MGQPRCVTDPVPFADLALAAYCPRKCYYRRRDARETPPVQDRARDLAGRYPTLLVASDAALASLDLAVPPAAFRRALSRTRDRLDAWSSIVDPPERDVFLSGRTARGRVQKVLYDPLAPVLVSPGEPPETGVWTPQSVRATAAAAALAWREQRSVEVAFVEYPRHGVIRRITVSGRRRGEFRRALDAVRALDGPPPRLHDDAKCGACEYADQCGVQTRSLRSLLAPGGETD